MPATGDLLAERYRILGPLGAGGMATVYRARDERLDREVALKVLTPNLAADPAVATRFEREARTLAAAAHPGVVNVFDVDPGDPATGREPFFVMELCPGGSLADRLAGDRRVAPDELIRIVTSVAEGLAGLHARGVVHRDVKPSNILLAPDRAKLADFGLARSGDAARSDLTAPGTVAGTMAYLAPEMLAGEAPAAPADVYALGVTAFAGLTGSLPRPGTSLAEQVRTAREPAPTVSDVAADLGTSFDAPIAAALGPDPARRPDAPRFASSLTSALEAWQRAGSPMAASVPEQQPDDEGQSVTIVAVPVPPEPTARIALAPVPTKPTAAIDAARPRKRSSRRRPRAMGLSAGAVTGAVVAIAILVIAGGNALTGLPPASSPPSASPSPSSSASPPPLPTEPTQTDPISRALDELDAAIADAAGRGGLTGRDRNELERLLADVRAALAAGDRDEAKSAAEAVKEKVDEVDDELDGDLAKRLNDAAAAVLKLIDVGGDGD